MTDPLRPFTQAIHALWRARARRSGSTTDSTGGGVAMRAGARSRAESAGETLHSRLRSRISALDGRDPKKMREVFVKTVLIWELGEKLAPDPGFAEVVARVSEQLAADSNVGDRLHQLLRELADKRDTPR
jgi:hypothetical protein